MHLKKKVRVFVKESWKYEERARRLSLTVFQPQTKRGRQRIYRESKISLGFDWWNRNTRYAKKMHINFFCKKNNKSNKLQCLVVCFLEKNENLMKPLNSETPQKKICLNVIRRMKMVYDQSSPISWLKRKPVTEQTSLSTAHTYPPMSSDLHHIMCTYIFTLFLYGSNSIHKTETHEYPPMSSDLHHITHIYFLFSFVWLLFKWTKQKHTELSIWLFLLMRFGLGT